MLVGKGSVVGARHIVDAYLTGSIHLGQWLGAQFTIIPLTFLNFMIVDSSQEVFSEEQYLGIRTTLYAGYISNRSHLLGPLVALHVSFYLIPVKIL